ADLMGSVVPSLASSLPIIGMQDGRSYSCGTAASPDKIAATLVELLTERHAAGSALWVTVTFADELVPARELLALLRRRFDVRYALMRPLGPAGYIVLGSKAVGVSVHPVAAMKLMVNLPPAG
ncbi:MAG TPA: DegV family protein, partial [Pseudomonadota bacterium]|nr:DegV family protein [Pseudomonadota bacterium]